MRNVLITGPPRSGTTLVCSLLNKMPDVVALHEPMNVFDFVGQNPDKIVRIIEKFCAESRESLLKDGSAISKHVGGEIRDNAATGEVDRRGKRARKTEHGRVTFDKPLSQEFRLAIKHPAAFTALLGTLSKHFECIAIIRNPLATLSSWNSLEWLPSKDGHLPVAEKLDVDLARALAKESDPSARQIYILEWFYDQFRRFLPESAVIKYEELIASRGRELAKILPAASELNENLSSKNVSEFYDRALMIDIGQRLLKRDGPLWNFYEKGDIEKLLSEISAASR
jgi:hypothetical protein